MYICDLEWKMEQRPGTLKKSSSFRMAVNLIVAFAPEKSSCMKIHS